MQLLLLFFKWKGAMLTTSKIYIFTYKYGKYKSWKLSKPTWSYEKAIYISLGFFSLTSGTPLKLTAVPVISQDHDNPSVVSKGWFRFFSVTIPRVVFLEISPWKLFGTSCRPQPLQPFLNYTANRKSAPLLFQPPLRASIIQNFESAGQLREPSALRLLRKGLESLGIWEGVKFASTGNELPATFKRQSRPQ